jgi:hypothetical protein
MNAKTILISSLFTLGLSSVGAFAQDGQSDKHTIDIKIPKVAILDLESSGNVGAIQLEAAAPNEAGLPLDLSKSVNSEIWINYSSIIGKKTEPKRDVTVEITDGNVPDGLKIVLQASKDAGQGEGTVGEPLGDLDLSNAAQKLIGGVGSAYTGNGPNAGHNLTYTLKLIEGKYADLDFDQTGSITVTFTLTDN